MSVIEIEINTKPIKYNVKFTDKISDEISNIYGKSV